MGKQWKLADFILGGSKITADGDCSHEIKRHLLLGRKVVTNLDSILKSRDITLPTKACLVKGMVFPVAMYGCESWTIKKAEHQRIDAFELWCWRRLLKDPWTARRSNQSILKRSVLSVHWKDRCSSWNSNTLATWCEELTHLKRPLCWERLRAGGEGDNRGRDGWMASPTQWRWVWVNSKSWRWTGRPGVLWSMGLRRVWHNWATELNIVQWKYHPPLLNVETERYLFYQSLYINFYMPGESNGTPLQCSCLENPRDGGAWWAAVYGVAQSRTRLTGFSSSSSSNFYMPDTVLDSGDTKVTKAIIFGLKDSATITVQFEHCKDSSMDEMC